MLSTEAVQLEERSLIPFNGGSASVEVTVVSNSADIKPTDLTKEWMWRI